MNDQAINLETTTMTTETPDLLKHTTAIVASYLSSNAVMPEDLSAIILIVHVTLVGIVTPPAKAEVPVELTPAVPIRKSVTHDYIISLEDGRKFKSMRRYLGLLGMTPDEYRAKWGLPADYPMVAPGYAARRSELAKAAGLGRSAAA